MSDPIVLNRLTTATRTRASAAGISAPPSPPAASTPRSIRCWCGSGFRAGATAAGQSELCEMSAVELAARLARKQVSAREVMTAHLAQIERVNPKINAIVTLVAEQAMAGAAKADDAIMRRDPVGVLARPAGGA